MTIVVLEGERRGEIRERKLDLPIIRGAELRELLGLWFQALR
jgi:hypothetical protein